jgi:predicted negative regulator of RcsB-dependent stress response
VDEYLSEKEQIEQIRQWWSDYGWYLLGGVAIGLLSIFGYLRYQDSVAASAEAAAALYSQLEAAVEDDDLSEAERVLATLQAEHDGSPYADNGALMLARMTLVSDTGRAIEALRHVFETSRDDEIRMIARLRLARVLAWRERYDEALELLSLDQSGPFAARMSDIRGDVLLASGDGDGARAAYTAALIMPGSDSIDRNYLQMKLSNLLVAEPAEVEAREPGVDLEAVEAAMDGADAAATEEAGNEP